MMTAREALAALWRQLGGPAEALEAVSLSGCEPALPSSFRVGTAAQVSIAAAALAAAEVWRLRGGGRQGVVVNLRHAAVEFRSERYLRVDGRPAPPLWDRIAGPYRCGDGRWLRVHTNFAHHRDGLLRLLDCANDRDAVARALAGWSAEDCEDAAAERGLVAAMMRTPEDWTGHPQGRALAGLPLIEITRIGEAPPAPLPLAARPLTGVRVLDLTRIIAGPVGGRVLAAHGAEVLRIAAPHLPSVAPLVIDTGRGKRSAHIDLRDEAGRARLGALLAEADVLFDAYRPGGLAAKGFGPDEAAALRPGLVTVSLTAYGHAGPWAGRRGFDSLVQTASGFNWDEAAALGLDGPKELPCQTLDHASGTFMALGAMMALCRRAREGGSWRVRVSLARSGQWLRALGRLESGFDGPDPGFEEVTDLIEESESGFGRLSAVRHAGRLSETPPRWALPAMPLGSHPPEWSGESADHAK